MTSETEVTSSGHRAMRGRNRRIANIRSGREPLAGSRTSGQGANIRSSRIDYVFALLVRLGLRGPAGPGEVGRRRTGSCRGEHGVAGPHQTDGCCDEQAGTHERKGGVLGDPCPAAECAGDPSRALGGEARDTRLADGHDPRRWHRCLPHWSDSVTARCARLRGTGSVPRAQARHPRPGHPARSSLHPRHRDGSLTGELGPRAGATCLVHGRTRGPPSEARHGPGPGVVALPAWTRRSGSRGW